VATSARNFSWPFAGVAIAAGEKRFIVQIAALTLLSVAFAYYAAFFLGTARPNLSSKYLGLSLLGLVLIAGFSLLTYALGLLLSGERRPLPKVWDKARSFVTLQTLLEKVLPILLVFAFLGAFTQMKALIPVVHPFAWDSAFSETDRFIFGTDPWRLTHAVIGQTETRIIDAIYLSWFPVFTCVLIYHSIFAEESQKRRFFLSLYGAWLILGIIAAAIFSSAGPCFLDLIGSSASQNYAGLFPTSPASQRVMNYLANTYRSGQLGIGTGISAMPSLHVAMAFLYVLMARKPAMRAIALAYALLIFVGSVHIGWHYACDGIFGVVGMWAIYSLTAPSSQSKYLARPSAVSVG
jgi:hypothetical protein